MESQSANTEFQGKVFIGLAWSRQTTGPNNCGEGLEKKRGSPQKR